MGIRRYAVGSIVIIECSNHPLRNTHNVGNCRALIRLEIETFAEERYEFTTISDLVFIEEPWWAYGESASCWMRTAYSDVNSVPGHELNDHCCCGPDSSLVGDQIAILVTVVVLLLVNVSIIKI